jgi:hypothetical protein
VYVQSILCSTGSHHPNFARKKAELVHLDTYISPPSDSIYIHPNSVTSIVFSPKLPFQTAPRLLLHCLPQKSDFEGDKFERSCILQETNSGPENFYFYFRAIKLSILRRYYLLQKLISVPVRILLHIIACL